MKAIPAFGFISGIATAIGFLPHSLFLLVIALSHAKNITLYFLLFTVAARILGDWIFWSQIFPSRMDSGENVENWRSSVREILFSRATPIGAMCDMIVDAVIDAFLLYMAFKASASSVLIFLVFSACQSVAAPAQGILILIFSKKNVRVFSMMITAIATFAALEVNGILHRESFANLLDLSQLGKPITMLIILGAKCLFTGTTVIGKATIAEIIKIKTMKKVSIE